MSSCKPFFVLICKWHSIYVMKMGALLVTEIHKYTYRCFTIIHVNKKGIQICSTRNNCVAVLVDINSTFFLPSCFCQMYASPPPSTVGSNLCVAVLVDSKSTFFLSCGSCTLCHVFFSVRVPGCTFFPVVL